MNTKSDSSDRSSGTGVAGVNVAEVAGHTHEPWHVTVTWAGEVKVHGDPDGDMDTDSGRTIDCTDYVAVMEETARAEANAARIVACVNACEGMGDPAEAILQLREEITQRVQISAVDGLTDRERELAAALRLLVDRCELPGVAKSATLASARDLIARLNATESEMTTAPAPNATDVQTETP